MRKIYSNIAILLTLITISCQENGENYKTPSTQASLPTVSDREWGMTVNGLRMSVASNKKEYIFGEDIKLTITIQNISDRALDITDSMGDYYYTPHIILSYSPQDGDSKIISLTNEGTLRLGNEKSHPVQYIVLKPGGWMKHDIYEVQRRYDMTMEGVYKVSVTRDSRALDDSPHLISNTISIIINEKNNSTTMSLRELDRMLDETEAEEAGLRPLK